MSSGFHTPELPVTAVGYAPAFSAEQVVRNLGSEYDQVYVYKTQTEAASNIQHHSESVYEITVSIRKVED